ncbi:MAG: NAD-dependent epimerase/dehydratase family protein [Candidatus Aminicenantes bacterium]|nr:NAD-dependent epimerase/dehydratase family protein [Candidatus Aminicenantes bacterium]
MNVLVTGATGFVGSVLVPRLLRRAELRELAVLVPPEETLPAGRFPKSVGVIRADIRDRAAVAEACRGRSHVIHLAGCISYRRRDRGLLWAVNHVGTVHVVEGCLSGGVRRLVHVSTVGAVGFHRDGRPADEDTPFNWPPDFGYMASKRAGQQAVEEAARRKELPAVILNPASIMGPGDPNPDTPHNRLYLMACRGALLVSFSGGLSVVDVRDLAALIERALDAGRIGEKYLVVGANIEYAEVVRALGRAAGRRAAAVKIPAAILTAAGAVLEAAADGFGGRPPLTRSYGLLSGWHAYHSNAKSRKEFGHRYLDFETTVRDGFDFYRRTFFHKRV